MPQASMTLDEVQLLRPEPLASANFSFRPSSALVFQTVGADTPLEASPHGLAQAGSPQSKLRFRSRDRKKII